MRSQEDSLATLHRRKSGGHYARVMGTLWRHVKTEEAGDAALGMLTRIWSHCADKGRPFLSQRDMAVIMAGDKNGPRKLKALLDARLLDRVEGGFAPHDWFDHNPGLAPQTESGESAADDRESNVSGTRVDGESNVTRNVTTIVTRNVSNAVVENQQVTPPPSRPKTQDPGSNTASYASGVAPAATEAPTGSPKARSKPQALVALERALANEMGRRSDVAPGLSRSLGQKASQRVAQHAEATGSTLDASAALLAASWAERGNGNAWKLCDVPFNAANAARPGARPRMSPATTHEDFADAEPVEVQLARLGGLK